MTRAEILAAIGEIGRRELGWTGRPEPGMRLVEDLELDSLRLLTLAVTVENRFEVCLSEEDEAAIETVGDLAAVVERRLAMRSGGEQGGAEAASGSSVAGPGAAE